MARLSPRIGRPRLPRTEPRDVPLIHVHPDVARRGVAEYHQAFRVPVADALARANVQLEDDSVHGRHHGRASDLHLHLVDLDAGFLDGGLRNGDIGLPGPGPE